LFTFYSGVGFISCPWDLILDYLYRPKPIDPGNFEDRKKILLIYADKIRQKGKSLEEDY